MASKKVDEQYRRYCFWLAVYVALLRQLVTEPIADGYVRKLARKKFYEAHDRFLNEDDDEQSLSN